MSEYLIQGSSLTQLADAIRAKTGGATPLSIGEMVSAINGLEVGSKVKTCTLEVSYNFGIEADNAVICCVQYIDGNFVTNKYTFGDYSSFIIENIVCSSLIYASYSSEGYNISKLTAFFEIGFESYSQFLYVAPMNDGDSCMISYD